MAHEFESTGGVMEPPRRSFLYKFFTVIVGAVLPLPAIAAAVAALVNPLRPQVRQKQAPSGSIPIGKDVGYFNTVTRGYLEGRGSEPERISIIADRKDAWNVYPKSQIGGVWLQKISDERLEFEKDWREVESLRAKVAAAPSEKQAEVFKDLLEVEFSRLQQEKIQKTGDEWTAKDTQRTQEQYSKLFPKYDNEVKAIASKAEWEGAVRVFNTSCPHAGCAVDYKKDEAGNPGYFCPCHDSVFAMDGARSANSPSPRGLDRLRYGYAGENLCVKFQNFKAGHEEKEPS